MICVSELFKLSWLSCCCCCCLEDVIGGIVSVLPRNRIQKDTMLTRWGEKRWCLFRKSLVTKACGAEEPC